MSSSRTLAEEISARLANAPTKLVIRTNDAERVATIEDLREYLEPFGLDVTTHRALAWGIANPIQAEHIDQICDLQQQIDALTQATPLEKKASA